MHFLLAKSIPLDRLNEVHQKLIQFFKEFQSLYGIPEMKHNTHLLIHLADTKKLGTIAVQLGFPIRSNEWYVDQTCERYTVCTQSGFNKILLDKSLTKAMANLCTSLSAGSSIEGVTNFITGLLKGYKLWKSTPTLLFMCTVITCFRGGFFSIYAHPCKRNSCNSINYIYPLQVVCAQLCLPSIFQNIASKATAGMFATTRCGCRDVYYLCHMLCMSGFIYFIVFHNAIEQVHISSGWIGPFKVFWT